MSVKWEGGNIIGRVECRNQHATFTPWQYVYIYVALHAIPQCVRYTNRDMHVLLPNSTQLMKPTSIPRSTSGGQATWSRQVTMDSRTCPL